MLTNLEAVLILIVVLLVWHFYFRKEKMTQALRSQITLVPDKEQPQILEDLIAPEIIAEANVNEQLSLSPKNMDELIIDRMNIHNHRAKEALDGRARVTKNLYQKYFTNELDENENREWWSTDEDQVDF